MTNALERCFSLRGLDHLVLRTTDVPRMLHFYVDLLGCRLEREQPEIGLIQLRVDEHTMIDLVTVDGVLGKRGGASPASSGRNVDHFCLRVWPYDEPALRAYCIDAGLTIVESGTRYGAEGEGPSIYVQDPEQNIVELKAAMA